MKDPCQKAACNIQTCLQANRYQESACVAELNALKECCKIWREESAVCKGIKIEPDNDSKPNATQKKGNTKKRSKLEIWTRRNLGKAYAIVIIGGLTIFFSRPLYDLSCYLFSKTPKNPFRRID